MVATRMDEKLYARQQKVAEAIAYKRAHKAPDGPSMFASETVFGSTYGVGIGLFLKSMRWLRWLFGMLVIASIPYWVMVNTAKFTTPQLAANSTLGVTSLQEFSLFSFTFAAIMDPMQDNGTLTSMNMYMKPDTLVPTSAIGKASFLIGISITDASTMGLFMIGTVLIMYMARKFTQKVDDQTTEVADYTLIVKGLPECDPVEVGEYFAQFGKVMDVVQVKDFGPLLGYCAKATELEKRRESADDALSTERAMKHQATLKKNLGKAEKRMQKFMTHIEAELSNSKFPFKAAFVTFNTEQEKEACMDLCPQSWSGSFFQRKSDRFQQQHRFWVEKAMPPEDYIYENLHYGSVNRWIRRTALRVFVFAILVVCAISVTKLQAEARTQTSNLLWDTTTMQGQIAMAQIADSQQHGQPLTSHADYCTHILPNQCSTLASNLANSQVSLSFNGSEVWASAAEKALKEGQVLTNMNGCAQDGASKCQFSGCMPCYCMARQANPDVTDGWWLDATKQFCGSYLNSYDMRGILIRAAISTVIFVLNQLLRAVLRYVIKVEKHWTWSDEEAAFANLYFVSQLMNSVLVLVLVTAQVRSASIVINDASNSASGGWFSNIILSGDYPDFDKLWYTDVGLSVLILLIINAVFPIGWSFATWVIARCKRSWIINCKPKATQEQYNAAWIGEKYELSERIGDTMINVWLALMFGSGMPIMYLVAWLGLLNQDYTDRHTLTKRCQTPNRYSTRLVYLLFDMLEWAALAHCAFGVWMHTHYPTSQADYINSGFGAAQSSSQNTGVTNIIAMLQESTIVSRISQQNGLPLLSLFFIIVFWMLVVKFLLWGILGSMFESCCDCNMLSCLFRDRGRGIEVTYEDAITGISSSRLHGAPTYRLPHHPKYADAFTNPLYLPIWFKAFGRSRYTRIVSRKGGFRVTKECLTEHNTADLEEVLKNLPQDVQNIARRLSESPAGTGKNSPRVSAPGRSHLGSDGVVAVTTRARIGNGQKPAILDVVRPHSPMHDPRFAPVTDPRSPSTLYPDRAEIMAQDGVMLNPNRPSFTNALYMAASAAQTPRPGSPFASVAYAGSPDAKWASPRAAPMWGGSAAAPDELYPAIDYSRDERVVARQTSWSSEQMRGLSTMSRELEEVDLDKMVSAGMRTPIVQAGTEDGTHVAAAAATIAGYDVMCGVRMEAISEGAESRLNTVEVGVVGVPGAGQQVHSAPVLTPAAVVIGADTGLSGEDDAGLRKASELSRGPSLGSSGNSSLSEVSPEDSMAAADLLVLPTPLVHQTPAIQPSTMPPIVASNLPVSAASVVSATEVQGHILAPPAHLLAPQQAMPAAASVSAALLTANINQQQHAVAGACDAAELTAAAAQIKEDAGRFEIEQQQEQQQQRYQGQDADVRGPAAVAEDMSSSELEAEPVGDAVGEYGDRDDS